MTVTATIEQNARSTSRDRMIAEHYYLAERLAHRFDHRGVPHDDLVQTAAVGLVKAVDRFDPERGTSFSAFAVPTMIGEIKRYFRDRTWEVRPPRALQELSLDIGNVRDELAQALGRAPTVAEVAKRLNRSEEDVLQGMECASAYHAVSLDAPVPGDDTISLADTLGASDERTDFVDNWESLRPLLARLDERDRRLLHLRFVESYTQSQIGAELGISQMQVSRLLARCLQTLREGMSAAGSGQSRG